MMAVLVLSCGQADRRQARDEPSAEPTTASADTEITDADLDAFEARLQATEPYFDGVMIDLERGRLETLLRAAQVRRPGRGPWADLWQSLFAQDRFAGHGLRGDARREHYRVAMEYLQASHEASKVALGTVESRDAKRQLTEILPIIEESIALAAVEAGETGLARRLASKRLRNNHDPKYWNYGNTIHDMNQILGRVALREGDVDAAGRYLLEAGRSPGSPQLSTSGPSMSLARELLERGEREVVLEYLDLVAKILNRYIVEGGESENGRRLQNWRAEIERGRIPDHRKWD